jgi:hypothetical protein
VTFYVGNMIILEHISKIKQLKPLITGCVYKTAKWENLDNFQSFTSENKNVLMEPVNYRVKINAKK